MSLLVSHIPGLRFIPNFLNKAAQGKMLQKSLSLHEKISFVSQNERSRIHLSKQHNLIVDRFYQMLNIDGQYCQHFARYTEDGHALTYFQNNKNVPTFVKEMVIQRMEELEEVKKIKLGEPSNSQLNWKFTFNTYKANENHVAGFAFHTDIRSNGDVTAILTLLTGAELQMKKPEAETSSFSLQLTPGSLLVLSDEARWDWQHRVLPQKLEVVTGEIARLSLVVGCR